MFIFAFVMCLLSCCVSSIDSDNDSELAQYPLDDSTNTSAQQSHSPGTGLHSDSAPQFVFMLM